MGEKIHDLQVHHNLGEKSQNATKAQSAKATMTTKELQQPVFLHLNNGKEDISGSCQVTYTVSEDAVLKTKDLHSCIRPKFGFRSINKASQIIFGVLWQPTSKTHYSVEGSLIKTALSEESHTISLILKSAVGVNITSRQHLELVTQKPGSKELPGKSLRDALAAVLGKPQLIHILRNFLKTLAKKKRKMDLSKASTTWRFCNLVQMLRNAKKKDILLLLKEAPEGMVSFYVEAAVAAQSTASLTALAEFLDFGNKKQVPLLEKFLYATAFSPRPSKELLHLVLEIKLRIETLVQELKTTSKDSEKVIYLLSLKNALLPSSIPTLLHYAEEGSAATSATALSALQRYSTQHISDTVKKAMKRIFHEVRRPYPKISRLAAAEILLDNDPSPMDFTNTLLATREIDPEMSRFLLSKIQGILHSHHHSTRQLIKDVLKDPRINNYYFLSAGLGSSTSFCRPLAVTSDTLSTFGLELLFSDFGLLRKSSTSFNILSHGHQLQAAQVAIEAKGFEGLLGGGSLADDEEEFMAGMSAVLLDVQLRPVVFFEGYTDLMSKFLMSSGEPTSVVKGNVLLMDHQQAIPLQSGLQTVITLQGGLGLDVSADINVNLWEQELKTGIKTRGALTIDFQAELDAPFFQATVKSQTGAEMATNFNTAAKLSGSPVLMCLQLTEEQVSYREIFMVSESSANHSATIRKRRQNTIPGREVPLHQANSEMCKILLSEAMGQ
ncbi:hypothetical protein JD844_006408 [Phrynosoma platyrhinos]|uniref:Vitellogenin domain-containing protein n=1 Tax=Phrynosoma platyrhinos TaxID=52577 RepID=A0ABQ7T2R0_PHRPL|nr:hypothetical protein JD844_006408 [Phrynosoma platyrhinos]